MNRPLKRKLAIATMAYLDSRKTGMVYAGLTIVTGASTTLAQEIAGAGDVTEPPMPYAAVDVATVADPELPGVCAFELVVHLKTSSTDSEDGTPSTRFATDAMLRAIYDVLMTPTNDDAAFSDSNPETAAFRAFANKPQGTDSRPAYRTPLHIYDMRHTTAPSMFDSDNWHDQLVFAGVAQDMDDH